MNRDIDIKSTALSIEQVDYIREMMNIAAGNAAEALSKLTKQEMTLSTPRAYVLPFTQALSVFEDPLMPAVCVKMMMVGDAGGYILFILPQKYQRPLLERLYAVTPGTEAAGGPEDLSTVTEVGNIMAGSYLTAIHEFSDLNIYHTVVVAAADVLQAMLDEPLAVLSSEQQEIFMVENEFNTGQDHITAYLLFIPFMRSLIRVAGSMEQARKKMMGS